VDKLAGYWNDRGGKARVYENEERARVVGGGGVFRLNAGNGIGATSTSWSGREDVPGHKTKIEGGRGKTKIREREKEKAVEGEKKNIHSAEISTQRQP